MKSYLKSLAALSVLFTPFSAFAANNYMILVDAGSTSSKLHVFQYEPGSMPVINDVFAETAKPGLSSFADHPESAGASLKKPLDDAGQFLQKQGVDLKTVPVNVFATAGMRLLPDDKQQAIYNNVTSYLKTNYQYAAGEVKTIPGKMEGLYGWLDVNYLANHFQNHETTTGSIDMGGASTQIAFATHDHSKPDDEETFIINHQRYTVFSKSFLGLGQDQARDAMTKDTRASACYPLDYQFSSGVGKFDFSTCHGPYNDIIQQQSVAEQILPTKGQSFIAYSGVYYTYQFFNVDKTPDQSILDSHIQSVCNEPWSQLQKDYPTVDAKYLSAYCANGVYQDQLLYSTYQLQGQQLTVVSQINQKDIDWTLGAILYSLVKHK